MKNLRAFRNLLGREVATVHLAAGVLTVALKGGPTLRAVVTELSIEQPIIPRRTQNGEGVPGGPGRASE